MTNVKQLYPVFKQSSGVCIDTRKITKGCLFFALKGSNFNGNLFAKNAMEQGALKAVVDDATVAVNDDYILVDDVLATLQELATFHRMALGIPVLAITGSNGKTTTKELVKAVLGKKYRTFATAGNLNNHIGVPLTLLSLNEDTEMAVVEMGANHPGEIAFLCRIAQPNAGLITNVGKAHLEGFGSFEGVKKTKGELYRFIEDRNGVLFVNKCNAHLMGMLNRGAQLFLYGDDEECKVKLEKLNPTPNLSFAASVGKQQLNINTQLIGAYNLENALAALAVGSYFGVEVEDIAQGVSNYVPDNNRSQLVVSDTNKILLDAYNANPTSMLAALQNFMAIEEDNKVLILGEMKELGADSDKEHAAILDFLKKYKSVKAFLVGDSYKMLLKAEEEYSWFSNVNDLMSELEVEKPILHSFVLIKGSRSNQLEKLIGVL